MGFAEGDKAKQWVCHETAKVLIEDAPAGAEILGPVVGTTTEPLDKKPKLVKMCSYCNNTNPGLTDKNGNRRADFPKQ